MHFKVITLGQAILGPVALKLGQGHRVSKLDLQISVIHIH